MYQSLISYIIVILVYSTHPGSSSGEYTVVTNLLLISALFLTFYVIVRRRCRAVYRKTHYPNHELLPALYDRLQLQLQIGAIIIFAVMVYGAGLGSLIALVPLASVSEGVNNLLGLSTFFLLQVIIWRESHHCFADEIVLIKPCSSYVRARLRFALGLMVPWLIMLFGIDILNLMLPHYMELLLRHPAGEIILFALFLILFTTAAPPLLIRFWNCRRLPDSLLRQKITGLCRIQKVGCRQILLWPAFEGRMATAAVVGAFSCSRYLLLTPDLIELLDDDEISAVVSHELGHVRYHHLLFFLFFFLSFFICNFFYYDLGVAWSLTTAPVIALLESGLIGEKTLLPLLETVPLLISYVIFFRYVFGFFLRNFERQADLASLDPPGLGNELVAAFTKLGMLLGAAGRKPNWHHFNIPQRLDFLRAALENPAVAARHHRSIKQALLLYTTIFTLIVLSGIYCQRQDMIKNFHYQYLGLRLEHRLQKVPGQPELWFLLGSFYIENHQDIKALEALRKARQLNPDDPEILNNLAWLLLTTDDQKLRDYDLALELSQKAAKLKPEPHILDTLAEACWRLNNTDKAVTIEEGILQNHSNSERKGYYLKQLQKFQQHRPQKKAPD